MAKMANSTVGYIALLRQLASFARLGRRSLDKARHGNFRLYFYGENVLWKFKKTNNTFRSRSDCIKTRDRTIHPRTIRPNWPPEG